ncbi:MAG: tetratricopeptide repeat protein [Betaproteobacteria bacterium]
MAFPLLAELQRRRVFRALVGYGVAAFAVLQIIEPVMHGLHWPDVILTYVVAALAIGFPVVVALAWIFDVNQGRLERTAGAPLRARVALGLVGMGSLAAVPGLVYYLGMRRPHAPRTEPPAASIAVLPLLNLSSDKEQEYFSDGLTEELLDLLAKVPGLRVAARTSAFAFKGKNEDVSTIARKLRVGNVLEGSVRKAGDRIRISTQLISAADGYNLWSETYDRRLNDVFAVQDEIAKAVVSALKLKLIDAPTAMDRRTGDAEAYTQYLLGKRLSHVNNVPAFGRAVQAFDKAVALDPGYAPAWAGLALARYFFGQESESAASVHRWQEDALAAAERAVALRGDLPDGYLARGFIRDVYLWDWAGSKRDLDRAVKLGPEDTEALSASAQLPRSLGDFPQAIAVFRKALDLDPLNPQTWSSLGSTLLFAGQLDAAREALQRSLEISPEQDSTAVWLGASFIVEGQAAKALASSQRCSHELFRLFGAAIAEHDLGHEKQSRDALERMIAGHAHDAAYQIAVALAWRGEKDHAFEWLERAFTARDGGMVLLKVDPFLRSLHGDPRYIALMKKMNLPLD